MALRKQSAQIVDFCKKILKPATVKESNFIPRAVL